MATRFFFLHCSKQRKAPHGYLWVYARSKFTCIKLWKMFTNIFLSFLVCFVLLLLLFGFSFQIRAAFRCAYSIGAYVCVLCLFCAVLYVCLFVLYNGRCCCFDRVVLWRHSLNVILNSMACIERNRKQHCTEAQRPKADHHMVSCIYLYTRIAIITTSGSSRLHAFNILFPLASWFVRLFYD